MITFRALQLIGSGQYTMKDLGRYVSFLEEYPELQKIFAKMVRKYPVSKVNDAMQNAKNGGSVKTVFAME